MLRAILILQFILKDVIRRFPFLRYELTYRLLAYIFDIYSLFSLYIC